MKEIDMDKNDLVWANKLYQLKQLRFWTNDTLATQLGITTRTLLDFTKAGGRVPTKSTQILIDLLLQQTCDKNDSECQREDMVTENDLTIPILVLGQEHRYFSESALFLHRQVLDLQVLIHNIPSLAQDLLVLENVLNLLNLINHISQAAEFFRLTIPSAKDDNILNDTVNLIASQLTRPVAITDLLSIGRMFRSVVELYTLCFNIEPKE